MASLFRNAREYLTPVLQDSAFLERGVLTPDEFVKAGDELVANFSMWQWQSGDPKWTKAYLPPDKQYLEIKNVPCHRRVAVMENDYAAETEVEGDGEGECWLATHGNGAQAGDQEEELEEIGGEISEAFGGLAVSGAGILGAVVDDHFVSAATAGDGGDDEYADMSTFEEDNLVEADEATLQPAAPLTFMQADEPSDNIVRTRTYNLSITYDKYYQTPRVWLFGFDESMVPLAPEAVFEDIMQDYANRTVTIESHPHVDGQYASIHPCQHAAVMKNIVSQLCAGGKEPQLGQYLLIFLKFIQSVIPTVDYDFTVGVEAK